MGFENGFTLPGGVLCFNVAFSCGIIGVVHQVGFTLRWFSLLMALLVVQIGILHMGPWSVEVEYLFCFKGDDSRSSLSEIFHFCLVLVASRSFDREVARS